MWRLSGVDLDMLPTKEDLLRRLRAHPLYKTALASVDPEQARRIAATTESFLIRAANHLAPVVAKASDPAEVAAAQEALNDDTRVVSLEQVSGSKDS